jgi:hypothetical protein
MKRSITISIPISPETKTLLDRIAGEEKLTVSELGRILLEEALARRVAESRKFPRGPGGAAPG